MYLPFVVIRLYYVPLCFHVIGEPKGRKGSPVVHNGPNAIVSPRLATRRPPTDCLDPSLEKGERLHSTDL